MANNPCDRRVWPDNATEVAGVVQQCKSELAVATQVLSELEGDLESEHEHGQSEQRQILEQQFAKQTERFQQLVHERDVAYETLLPIVNCHVLRIRQRQQGGVIFSNTLSKHPDTLQDDLQACRDHVFKKIEQFGSGHDAGFVGWSYRVVENHLRDRDRGRRRRDCHERPFSSVAFDESETANLETSPDDNMELPEYQAADQIDFLEPFSAADLATLNTWRNKPTDTLSDPILVLATFQWWSKVPNGQRFSWLRPLILSESCLDENLANIQSVDRDLCSLDRMTRQVALCNLFGMGPNSLLKAFARKRHQLLQLDYFWHRLFCDFPSLEKDELAGIASEHPVTRLVWLVIGQLIPQLPDKLAWQQLVRDLRLQRLFPWLTFLEEHEVSSRLRELARSTSSRTAHGVSSNEIERYHHFEQLWQVYPNA